jgi:hypothetical protein
MSNVLKFQTKEEREKEKERKERYRKTKENLLKAAAKLNW